MGKITRRDAGQAETVGERLVTVHIGYSSCQNYPSKLKGMWRRAYQATLCPRTVDLTMADIAG